MALKNIKKSEESKSDILSVELISVLHIDNLDPMRIAEIRHLVTRIVLLGKKRGRPSKQTVEVEDAA